LREFGWLTHIEGGHCRTAIAKSDESLSARFRLVIPDAWTQDNPSVGDLEKAQAWSELASIHKLGKIFIYFFSPE
jgi:hypothetical protein